MSWGRGEKKQGEKKKKKKSADERNMMGYLTFNKY